MTAVEAVAYGFAQRLAERRTGALAAAKKSLQALFALPHVEQSVALLVQKTVVGQDLGVACEAAENSSETEDARRLEIGRCADGSTIAVTGLNLLDSGDAAVLFELVPRAYEGFDDPPLEHQVGRRHAILGDGFGLVLRTDVCADGQGGEKARASHTNGDAGQHFVGEALVGGREAQWIDAAFGG